MQNLRQLRPRGLDQSGTYGPATSARVASVRRPLARALLLLAGVACAIASGGCARTYHDLRYNCIVRDAAVNHAASYYHSPKTGRVIPKHGGSCRTIEPDCFGYEPTCWTAWPSDCPSCPGPAEPVLSEPIPVESPAEGGGHASRPRANEPLERFAERRAPSPETLDPSLDATGLAGSSPFAEPEPPPATPLDVPAPLPSTGLERSNPSDSDQARPRSPASGFRDDPMLGPTPTVDPPLPEDLLPTGRPSLESPAGQDREGEDGKGLLEWFERSTTQWLPSPGGPDPFCRSVVSWGSAADSPSSVMPVVLRDARPDNELGLDSPKVHAATFQMAVDVHGTSRRMMGRFLADSSRRIGPALGSIVPEVAPQGRVAASPNPRDRAESQRQRPVFKIPVVGPPRSAAPVRRAERAVAVTQQRRRMGATRKEGPRTADATFDDAIRFRTLQSEPIRVGDPDEGSTIRFRR